MAKQSMKKQMNQLSIAEKTKRLEYFDEEFTQQEYDYSIAYVFSCFIMEQMTRNNSKATIDAYKRFYKKLCGFLNDTWNLKPEDTPTAILSKLNGFQAFFQMYLGDVKMITINHYLTSLRSFGNYAKEEGYIPYFKCPIKKVEPEVKQVYTKDEINKLLSNKPRVEQFEEFRNYVIIELLLTCGARTNTIINIKMKDVDIKEKTIFFNTTKRNKTYPLPLEKNVLRDLEKYISYWRTQGITEDDYLFVSQFNEPLTRGGLYKAIANYNKRHGVQKTGTHLFRHTFAKYYLQKSKNKYEAQKILGHSSSAMVNRYANIYGVDLEESMNKCSLLEEVKVRSGNTIKQVKKQTLSQAG